MAGNVQLNISGLKAAARAGAVTALDDEHAVILAQSQPRVPIGVDLPNGHKAGTLMRSGKVIKARRRGSGVEGGVSYDTAYARLQHERLDFRHPRGGQAKYLESVFNERAAGMAQRVGSTVARAMGI